MVDLGEDDIGVGDFMLEICIRIEDKGITRLYLLDPQTAENVENKLREARLAVQRKKEKLNG